jgi:hypothetical protein
VCLTAVNEPGMLSELRILGEDRLRFYQVRMHLSLVAGPLRIAGTSHPEHEWFRRLVEQNLQLALQFQA